jgi:methyl-accepting chemotaxis protein
MVRLRISHKLTLALAALLLATVAVAAVGISSLGDVDRRARALYDDNVRTTQATSAVGGGLSEVEETHQAQVTAEATHRAARSRILLLSAGAVLVWLVIALALVRDLVPRLQAYSRFAARVADGHLGERLTPGGADAELADTMQLSETEVEAHDLLRRHLERAIQDSRVTVLNRNNSADRLEPATPVEPECP